MSECCVCLLDSDDCQLYGYDGKMYCQDCLNLRKNPINYRKLKKRFDEHIEEIKKKMNKLHLHYLAVKIQLWPCKF